MITAPSPREQLDAALAVKESEITLPLDYAPAKLRIVIDSHQEETMRANSCAKEPETIAWLERECKQDDVLYDVGACIGAYSLVGAFLGARVYGFEPSAHNHRQFVRNIRLNDLRTIRAMPIGLGAKTLVRYLNLSSEQTGAASHVVSDFQTGALAQAFLEMPLDHFRQLFHAPAPTLMKIDVDGGELEVLLGAKAALADPALRSVQVELRGDSEAVRELMEESGFYEADRHKRLGNVALWNVEFRRAP